jgi:hypothetical protein
MKGKKLYEEENDCVIFITLPDVRRYGLRRRGGKEGREKE